MGLTDRNPMTVEVAQYVGYVLKDDDHANAHDTPRDGGRYCIRKASSLRLVNAHDIDGGAGRGPDDKYLTPQEESSYWSASNDHDYLLSVNKVSYSHELVP